MSAFFQMLLAAGSRGLPYTPVSYLESTGTQWIDTGIKPDFAGGDEIEIHLYGAVYSGAAPCVFGSRETGVKNGIYLLGLNNLTVADAAGYSGVQIPATAPGTLTFAVNDSTITANGNSYTMPRRVTCGLDVFLFALNNYNGSAISIYSGMRLYEWTYRHNGAVAQHLIPALDGYGVPCMWDTVSNTPLYNSGTGTFNYA